jgi:hypothetical protein
MRTPTVLLVTVAAASAAIALPVVTSSGASTSSPRPRTVSHATVDPGDFSSPRANPYFPLRPGTVTTYRGTDEGERLRERVYVTHRTRMIQGIRTRVVRDIVRSGDGGLVEVTSDWYAADNSGNVWYFGEATATYDDKGHVESREGSWQAGHDGARAGMIMPAHPHATQAFRQEYYRGHAEDQAWIVSRFGRTRTPLKMFTGIVRSLEWTRLEPGVVSLKVYAPGVGIVREKNLSGGSENLAVVSVRHE